MEFWEAPAVIFTLSVFAVVGSSPPHAAWNKISILSLKYSLSCHSGMSQECIIVKQKMGYLSSVWCTENYIYLFRIFILYHIYSELTNLFRTYKIMTNNEIEV